MTKAWISTVLAAMLFGVATPAASLTVSLVSLERSWDPAARGAQIGDTITVGVRFEGMVGVIALGISAFGYDENVLDFVGGTSVRSINHAVLLPGIGAFNGIPNIAPSPMVESSLGEDGTRVRIYDGWTSIPRSSSPLDPGLDGIIGGHDAHARLTFRLIGFGVDVIEIGPGYPGDGEALQDYSVNQRGGITILDPFMIVPEPSSALLAGMGLAVLAARRRGRKTGCTFVGRR